MRYCPGTFVEGLTRTRRFLVQDRIIDDSTETRTTGTLPEIAR
jgi:hypothetical protein